MKIKTIFISLFSAAVMSQAQMCTYSQKGQVDVGFTAFKTPLKIGVGGSFNEVVFKTNVQDANTLDALLVGSGLTINKGSVNTKNQGRDATLVTSFFNVLEADQISAKVLNIKETSATNGVITTRMTLNKVTVKVPMQYVIENGVMQGHGTIDLADFNAQTALESITKACSDLHQGKTWSDIDITFTMNIAKKCH